MKRKKRPLKALTIILIVSSVVVIFTFLGVYFYAETHIDYSIDEQLLRAARGEYNTRLYYDASYGMGEYTPKELVSKQSSNIKKWYSYGEIGDNVKNAFLAKLL